MSFLIDNWMLVLVALASGTGLVWQAFGKGGTSGIAPAQAVQLINREKAMLVDVCSAQEYATEHPVGAKNIPLDALAAQLVQAVKNKSTPVIFVCQAGSRSSRAAAQAVKLGYEKSYSIRGGLRAWREAQLPVERA